MAIRITIKAPKDEDIPWRTPNDPNCKRVLNLIEELKTLEKNMMCKDNKDKNADQISDTIMDIRSRFFKGHSSSDHAELFLDALGKTRETFNICFPTYFD